MLPYVTISVSLEKLSSLLACHQTAALACHRTRTQQSPSFCSPVKKQNVKKGRSEGLVDSMGLAMFKQFKAR